MSRRITPSPRQGQSRSSSAHQRRRSRAFRSYARKPRHHALIEFMPPTPTAIDSRLVCRPESPAHHARWPSQRSPRASEPRVSTLPLMSPAKSASSPCDQPLRPLLRIRSTPMASSALPLQQDTRLGLAREGASTTIWYNISSMSPKKRGIESMSPVRTPRQVFIGG